MHEWPRQVKGMKYPDVLSKPLAWLKLSSIIQPRGTQTKQVNEEGVPSSDSDILYKIRFRRILIPHLYKMHVETGYMCCVFCKNLKKSYCHSNCFICSKGVYKKCDSLLPGPSSLAPDSPGGDNPVTWMFKTSCKHFQRLLLPEYTRSLDHGNNLAVITNYETIEGLFYGISNGTKPCQICAVVDLKLFTECPGAKDPKVSRSPCKIILERVALSCKINGDKL